MASGYQISTGADLDTIFEPLAGGTAASATGFKNASNADLNTLYHAYVTGTKASSTGFKNSAGTDLNDIFQKLGEPLYGIGADWPEAVTIHTDNALSPTNARITFYAYSDGTYSFTKANGTNVTGDWLTSTGSGKGSGFYVKWAYSSGDAASGNSSGWSSGTYLECTTTRSFYLEETTDGFASKSGNFTITFATSSGGAGASAKTFSFNVNVEI